MDTKKVSILTIVIIALTLAFLLLDKSGSNSSSHDKVGKSLISEDELKIVEKITLSGQDADTVTIVKDENEWILQSYYGIPVNFERLNDFTRNLVENKLERFVSDQPSTINRLDINQNHITLSGVDMDWRLNIGKDGKSGGSFIQYGEDSPAYLSSDTLNLNLDNNHWAKKRLIDGLVESDIKSVSKKVKSLEILSFERGDSEDEFASETVPEGMQVNQAEVKSMIRNLLNLQFTEVKNLEDEDVVAGIEHSEIYEIQTFDKNQTYILSIGRKPEQVVPVEETGDNADSETAEDQPKEKTIPAGPVVVSVEFPDNNSVWSKVQSKIALIASSYTFTQFENLGEKLFEEKVEEESAEEVE